MIMQVVSAPPRSHARAHIFAITALLVLAIAPFWRVVLFGETIFDLAAHQNQLPWGAAATTSYPYNRRDLTDTYITRDYFVVDSYRRGELPLWNPYVFSGHPMYADGVTKPFAPANLLYLFFDVPLGYTIARLMELALAGIFLYLFLVSLGLSPGGAFTGGLVFILSDHVMHHLSWLGWMGALMWLPLMLMGADQAIKRARVWPAVLSGMALALHFYCGYMPTAIYYVGALALYYLIAPWIYRSRDITLQRALSYLVITMVVGFGLAAPVVWPIFELLGFSNRKIVPTEIGFVWLPPWQLPTLVLPRITGAAFDARFVRLFTEMGVSQDRSLYLGLISLIFIGGGIVKRRAVADGRVWYFVVLVALAILVMMCAPAYVHVTKYLPVLKTIRAVTRISGLYAFGGAVLAAYGAQRLLTAERGWLVDYLARVRRWALVILCACAGATILFTAVRGYLPRDPDAGGRARRWLLKIVIAYSEQFRIGSIDLLVPVAVLIIVITICFYCLRNELKPALVVSILLVVLAGELLWNGAQYNRTYERSEVFRATAATDLLKARIGLHRLVVAPAEFSGKAEGLEKRKIVAPPNTLVPYRLATIAGKDQLFPRWYRELTALVEPQPFLSHIVFNRTHAPLYDLLGVKYLVTKEANSIGDASYREIYAGEGVRVYENSNVMPRAFFAARVARAGTAAEALAVMKSEGFDVRATTVVETDTVIEASAPQPDDRAEIVRYGNNEVVVRTISAGARLLVLTDTYYPGWEVYVDGVPAQLLRANHALRGVAVAAGAHEVRFLFRPKPLRYGAAVAIVTLLGSIILLIFNHRGTESRERAEPFTKS